MTWYCWATTAIMLFSLAARQLPPHATENNRPLHRDESLAVPAQPFAPSGINDEIYRQRIM
jgi:hypothetical protein